MKEQLFQLIANAFPTSRIEDSSVLYTLWRGLFYGIRPKAPFIMETKYYRLHANPQKGNLSRTVARRGVWERNQTKLIADRLKKGMVFVDVGANFGHYALMASKLVGSEGKVLAFEPEPHAFSQLKENVDLLQTNNTLIFQSALGDTNGKLKLFVDKDNPGGHSLNAENLVELKETVMVDCYRLETLLEEQNISRVDLIKIDAQGAEGHIIEGCFSLIKKHKPTLFCEFEPASLKNMGYDPRDLLERFFSLGYKLSYIDNDHPDKVRPIPSADHPFSREKYDLIVEV